jgi:uncharacterized protein (TIGR01244 family)
MRKQARVATVVSVFALLAAALRGAPGGGIENFLRVDERVCTGAQPTIGQLAALKDEGVRGILNLRDRSEHDAAAEEAAAKELGLLYVNIPVNAAEPKPEQAEAFLRATADPSLFPIFIHCGTGNRVGAFWMIRRVLVDRWTPACAEKEARQIGLKSPSLRTFALEYIAAHPGKGAETPCSDGF